MTIVGSQTLVDATDRELEIFKDDIRMLLRDRAPNNILLDDVQFTDADVLRAVRFATNQFNLIAPSSSVSWRLVPEPILFLLTASWLTMSESFLQIRNQISVPSDGLGVIGIDDKWGQYTQMRESLRNEAEALAKQYKVQQNLESSYGSLSSGYAHVSRFRQV